MKIPSSSCTPIHKSSQIYMNLPHIVTPPKKPKQKSLLGNKFSQEIYEFCVCSGIVDRWKVFRIKKFRRCGKPTTFARTFKVYRAILVKEHNLSPLQGLVFQRRKKDGSYSLNIKCSDTPDDVGMRKAPSPEIIKVSFLPEV